MNIKLHGLAVKGGWDSHDKFSTRLGSKWGFSSIKTSKCFIVALQFSSWPESCQHDLREE